MTEAGQSLTLDGINRELLDPVRVGTPDMLAHVDEIVAEWATRPPFYIAVDDEPMLVVGRYEECREVLLDPERFSCELPRKEGYEKFDKFLGVRSLAQMDGSQHARIRRLIGPAFSPRALVGLDDEVRRVVDHLLDEIDAAPGDTCDGVRDFSAKLLDGILLTSMLRLDKDQRAVFHEMHRVIPLTATVRPGEPFPDECVSAFAAARETIHTLTRIRSENPGDDLISALVSARDEGDRLSDDELFDVVFTICVAALSGTARTMARTMFGLFRQPNVVTQMHADPEIVPQAIAEAQRMYRQGYFMFPRRAVRDTTVGGTPVPEGMIVRVSLHAASYDPLEFPNPTTFDIDRDPTDWMSYGLGEHSCVGIRLARMILRTALTRWVQRFPETRFADPDFKPIYTGAVGELRMESLPLRIRA